MFRSVYCQMLILLVVTISTTVAARPYISGAVGLSVGGSNRVQPWNPSDRFDMDHRIGLSAAAAIGYEWASKWRAEFEFSRRNYRLDERSRKRLWDGVWVPVSDRGETYIQRSYPLMGNVGLGLPCLRRVRPYVLGGLGAARVKEQWVLGPYGLAHRDLWTFAYQGIVGFELRASRRVRVGLQYRFFHTWSAGYSHSGEIVARWML